MSNSDDSEVVSSVGLKSAGGKVWNEQGKQVVIEMDASLISHNLVHPVRTARSIATSSDVSSTTSVAGKFGFFKISPNTEKDDESWSFISNADPRLHTKPSFASSQSEDESVVNSTESEFDLLSLNRAPKRRCQRCFYLNGDDDDICGGCCFSLEANLSKDLEEHSSSNLQLEDVNERAQEAVLIREKKRKALSQLIILSRSSMLVNDIERVVSSHSFCSRIGMLPVPRMAVLGSKFIERADNAKISGATKVSVAYQFSPKCNLGQKSFGPATMVSNNIEAAFSCSLRNDKLLLRKRGRRLPPIHEGSAGVANSKEEMEYLGWIVAIVDENHTKQIVNIHGFSGSAELKRPHLSSDILPLVYFEASLRNQDIIRRLVNGEDSCRMTQTCFAIWLSDVDFSIWLFHRFASIRFISSVPWFLRIKETGARSQGYQSHCHGKYRITKETKDFIV